MSLVAELSIVVVATNLVQVTACVDSFARCAALDRAEIVLVSTVDCSPLLARFPRLRIVAAGADWSFPRMRVEGLRGVSGTCAAVIGEDCRVGDDWAEAVVSDKEQQDVLVGDVIPHDNGLFAGAAYLWEYLHVAAPAAAGELTREQAHGVPAGAVVYKMNQLDIDLIAAADSEMQYHAALFGAGRRFRRDPRMKLLFAPAVHEFLSDRVRRSREWAASLPSRWLVGSVRIGLPIVLVGRFVARAAVRPRYWGRALLAIPFTLLYAGAETFGEMQGYFRRSV